MEDGVSSHPPQAPVSDLGLRGRESLGGVQGVLSVAAPKVERLETEQPDSCGHQQHCCSSAAHGCQLGLHCHRWDSHRDQQELGCSGLDKGDSGSDFGGEGTFDKTSLPGNYCWTHGYRISKEHMSASCANKAVGRRIDATASNTLGGS